MAIDVTSLYNRRRDNRWDRVSVGDFLERVTYSYPNKEAIVAYEGTYAYQDFARLTYQEAENAANQFANSLLATGLERGDRVLLYCDNSSEAMIAKLGIAKAGLVVVPVNTMVALDVTAHIIELTEPKFVLADAEHVSTISGLLNEKGIEINVVIPLGGEVSNDSQDFKAFLEQSSPSAPEIRIHGDDIWEILFTSGTTSMPKGAMISHHNTYFASYNYGMKLSRGLHLETDYKVASFLPVIYHVADQTLPGSAFLMGGTLLIGRKQSMEGLADMISREKVSALWAGSSESLRDLIEHYQSHETVYNFKSLTSIIYGYTALAPRYHDTLKAICSDQVLIWGSFSQTEVIAGFRFFHDQFAEHYYQNCPLTNYLGKPDPSLAAALMTDEGDLIEGPGKTGEVVYRSPQMFSGYYKNEKATEEALAFGWFHSGDLIQFDDHHLAKMVDRDKDIIKTGGESVSSSRVEAILRSHDDVRNAAVLGFPNDKWGEVVVGFVIKKDNSKLTESELISYGRQRLAGFETPKSIVFVKEFPETVASKILKYKLKEDYMEAFREIH
ncbi:class I adenylate-forming enzyme family protein [Streptococcus dysgalactiae]